MQYYRGEGNQTQGDISCRLTMMLHLTIFSHRLALDTTNLISILDIDAFIYKYLGGFANAGFLRLRWQL